MREKFENIRYITPFPPECEIEELGLTPEKTFELVRRELKLDAEVQLNYASLSTPVMENGADEIFVENLNVNFIEKPVYRQTERYARLCVSMLLNLFNADPCCDPTGVTTVSSTEAILLAGLNYKTRWESWGCNCGRTPKIIIGSNAAISWFKFARFFEVEPIVVPVRKDNRLDLRAVKDCLDDDVICVVGTMGNTFTGAFDNVEGLNHIIDEYNCYNEWKIPIHVDAAGGGFIAPFYPPFSHIEWDFRLKWVEGINVTAGEYGQVYPGIGFALWKRRSFIVDDLIYEFDYFGAPQENFTLNFTKSGANIAAQYYLFNRLGKEGYCEQTEYFFKVKEYIIDRLIGFKYCGERVFEEVCNYPGNPEPVIKLRCPYRDRFSLKEIERRLREFGWRVTVYNLPCPREEQVVMKIAVKIGMNLGLAERLTDDIFKVICNLD